MQNSKWPLALPHDETKFFLSVVCGNTHMHWGFHERTGVVGSDGLYFQPTILWKTGYLTESEKSKADDSIKVLARYLQQTAKDIVFGRNDFDTPRHSRQSQKQSAAEVYTPEQLTKHAAQRRAPTIHVYVLSTTTHERVQDLDFLFQKLPVCLWNLQRQDFIMDGDQTLLKGTYDTLGLDRIASVLAAKEIFGAPTLVIDGGTALTYTALDQDGAFMGGGIMPGVDLQSVALCKGTGQLPYIPPQQILDAVELRLTKRNPLPPLPQFSKENTEENIMAGVVYEMADTLVGIVYRYRSQLFAQQEDARGLVATAATGKPKVGDDPMDRDTAAVGISQCLGDNGKPHAAAADAANDDTIKDIVVVVAGGDATLIAQLLEPDHSGIIQPVRAADVLKSVRVVNAKHRLCHVAVDGLVTRKMKNFQLNEFRAHIIGQRVARSFPDNPAADGDTIHRATIAGLQDVGTDIDDDWYLAQYDKGQVEELQIKDIYNGLKLYHDKGEKELYRSADDPADAALWFAKRQQAMECATILQAESKQIKALYLLEQRKTDKSAATVDAAAVAVALTTPPTSPATNKRSAPTASSATNGSAKPSTKKLKSTPSSSKRTSPGAAGGRRFIGTRICKYFGEEGDDSTLYFGSIKKFTPANKVKGHQPLWFVVYDDNDREDFTYAELVEQLELYAKKADLDAMPQGK